ncbi:SusC/RagA family TonB-linked outer membrane protein [Thalassobellus sediminis]|uniref:SusC/RagA family TonB-linked outer membrane protein n=1 Tax=Thalassobellus sediminis TaxID=3367753 RepID=UPI0037891FB5
MKKKLCRIPNENRNDYWDKILDLMRKSLILFIIFINVTAFAFSQKVTLSVENKSVYDVLNTLTEKTGVTFFYNYDTFNVKELVNVNVKDTDLLEVVSQIIGSNYQAKFTEDNLIIIVPNTQAKIANQQEIEVSGIVTDKNGVPMPSVTVINKSKDKWDVTKNDGSYKITVQSDDTLIFSFLGFKDVEVPVNSRSYIAVTMEERLTELNEVNIVSYSNGYTKIPKERATGSFGFVTAKDLEKTPTIDINERLEGIAPGVNVNVKTGEIEIRGTNSFSKTEPLIVIDGFPLPQDGFDLTKRSQGKSILSYVNSDDIESITVLKDAAAAAIWGSGAANGVIVITTKTGRKSQEPTVNFSSSTTIGSKISLDNLRQMSTSDYVDFEKEMVNGGFLVDNSWNWQNTNPSEVQNIMFKAQRGEITEAEQNAMLNELSNRNNQDQINKYLLGNSVSQQYDFSISGGSDTHNYYISTGYNKDDAVMKSNNSSAYYVTLNNTVKLNSILSLETGINYVKSDYIQNNTANDALSNATSSPYNASSALHPYDMIVDASGNGINHYLRFTPEAIQQQGLGVDNGYLPWTYNYLDELNMSNTKTKGDNIRLNAKLTAKVTDWLNVEASGMYTSIKNSTNTLNELDSYYTRNLLNQATTYQFGERVYGIPLGAHYSTSNRQTTSQSMRLQLNINKSFNDIHNISFTAGSEVREERGEGSSQTRYGYDTNTNTSQETNSQYPSIFGWDEYLPSVDQNVFKSKDRALSYYSLGSYSYKNKYTVSGSIRLDDFNLLGAKTRKDRAIPFWSTGVSWNISEENFLRNADWLNTLSLKATYGKGGSAPSGGIGNSNAIISVGNNDWNTQLPITDISLPENSELKWEITNTWNFGLNFGLFNNRLSGNLDFYSKKSEDILTYLPHNSTYGWSYLQYNAGTLKGKGVDLGLTGFIFRGDFQWKSTFNFSYNTNEVTDSRFEPTAEYELIGGQGSPITGKPLGSVYAYKWAGLDATGQSQIFAENGDIIDASVWNDQINLEDVEYMGVAQAPYFGGLFNTFSYKNFSVGVRMTYYMGHVFRNRVLQNYPTYVGGHFGSVSNDAIVANRWKTPGDELTTNVPGLANISYNSLNRFQNADINVLPADHLRLQQISLGYNMPSQWLKNTFFKSMSVSFTARNLGIIWRKNDEGIDPLYLSNNNYSTLPPERNYTLQFNLGF